MIHKPENITWLIETPAGKAGFSVRDGLPFLHYSANPDDFRAASEVKQHAGRFFEMVKARGFPVGYSVVPTADTKLNKFQRLAGMEFLTKVLDHNVYQKVF